MANTGNPFGDLSYAPYVPTYVGLPLDRAKETGDVLQGKYNVAKENASKLEIAMANIQMHEKDEPVRTMATEVLTNTLNTVKEKGNWEDAGYLVQSAATDVGKNRGLIAATKSYQMKQEQMAALQDRVNKGEILQEDIEYEVAKAEEKYQGVRQNPITGAWEGYYNMTNPPTYVDVGKYTDEFLNGFKSDEWMGMYKKGADGKWYKGNPTGEVTADGQYIYMPSTEEATYDEVYLAAREQVLQNQQIQERVDYDLSKKNVTFADKVSHDPNAKLAMQDDLVDIIGYDKSKVEAMTDDQLALAHEKEMMLHQQIDGSSLKHSYRKEKFQTLGETWDFKQWQNKVRVAAGGGGDDKTVIVDQTYLHMMTQGYTPSGNPISFEEFNKQLTDMEAESNKREISIQEKKKEIEDWKTKNPGKDLPETYVQQLSTMETARARHDNAIVEFNKRYNEAVDRVNAKFGIDYKAARNTFNEFIATQTPENVTYANNVIKNITTLQEMTGLSISDLINDRGLMGYDSKTVGRTLIRKYNERQQQLGKESNPQDITNLMNLYEQHKSFIEGVNTKNVRTLPKEEIARLNAAKNIVKEWGTFEETSGTSEVAISEELALMAKEKTTNYAYIDLSTDFSKTGESVDSQFSKTASQLFKNAPHNFTLIATNGEEIGFENNPDSKYYNHNHIRILGPTTDYVHKHGTVFYAQEQVYDDKGKPTGEVRNHLFKDNTGSFKKLAIKQMQQGRLMEGDKIVSEKGLNEMDDAIYKFLYEDVDAQISVFQNHPNVPPDPKSKKQYNTIDTEIILGPNKRAKVTKKVDKVGDVSYDVEYGMLKDENGVTWQSAPENYTSIANLEQALEHYAGYGKENDVYAVDLGTLKQITEAEIPYAKFAIGMQSMPRLHYQFANEFKALANEAKLPFTITSMTRSKNLNSKVNGDENSGHLHGKGIDISLKEQKGAEFYRWLMKNSVERKGSNYRKVNNYNIIFETHDRGSGNHIDIKYLEE